MRDVAVVSFAQTHHRREVSDINEVEMLMPILGEALDGAGIKNSQVDFVCSASSDYLAGRVGVLQAGRGADGLDRLDALEAGRKGDVAHALTSASKHSMSRMWPSR